MSRNEEAWSVQNLDNLTYGARKEDVRKVLNPELQLSAYILVWLEAFKKRALKPASYARLETASIALKRYPIASKPVKDITFFDIQDYINQLTDSGYALTTIQKQFRLLTAPLKQAAAMRLIQSDPTAGVVLPSASSVKKSKRDILAYNEEEQRKLWAKIVADDCVAGYCVGFMLETGLRPGEALALRWKDVDISRNRIRVCATVVNPMHKSKAFVQETPKSLSSQRIVPLNKRAIEMLMKARMCSDSEWVFESNGDRLSYAALVYQTKKLCREAGIKYCGEHVLRHTFATNCYYKGVDVKILSKLLGHSTTNVTYNTYINLYGDAFEEMYKAIC